MTSRVLLLFEANVTSAERGQRTATREEFKILKRNMEAALEYVVFLSVILHICDQEMAFFSGTYPLVYSHPWSFTCKFVICKPIFGVPISYLSKNCIKLF